MKIVIEDYYGNDLCTLRVVGNIENSIVGFDGCSHADTDVDDKGETFMRIQLNEHPADKGDRLYHEEQDHKAMEKANDR